MLNRNCHDPVEWTILRDRIHRRLQIISLKSEKADR